MNNRIGTFVNKIYLEGISLSENDRLVLKKYRKEFP